MATQTHPGSAAPSPADRIFRSCWQDGSLDLAAGLAVAAIGIAWLLDLVALGPAVPAIAIPAWVALRRSVIEPRIGRVRFAAARRDRLRRGHRMLLGFGCLVLTATIAGFFAIEGPRPEWLRIAVAGLPAALVALAAAIAALLLDLPRLALHAIPLVAAGVVVAAFGLDPGWSLLAGGLVVATIGLALLLHFLRAFPPLPTEPDS